MFLPACQYMKRWKMSPFHPSPQAPSYHVLSTFFFLSLALSSKFTQPFPLKAVVLLLFQRRENEWKNKVSINLVLLQSQHMAVAVLVKWRQRWEYCMQCCVLNRSVYRQKYPLGLHPEGRDIAVFFPLTLMEVKRLNHTPCPGNVPPYVSVLQSHLVHFLPVLLL